MFDEIHKFIILGIPIREITSSDALMASITGGTDNVENVWTKHGKFKSNNDEWSL